MTPREFELLLYYGKKTFNWLLVLFLAGYILWIAAPNLAILIFILLGIFVLFLAHEGWKTYREMRPAPAPKVSRSETDTSPSPAPVPPRNPGSNAARSTLATAESTVNKPEDHRS